MEVSKTATYVFMHVRLYRKAVADEVKINELALIAMHSASKHVYIDLYPKRSYAALVSAAHLEFRWSQLNPWGLLTQYASARKFSP